MYSEEEVDYMIKMIKEQHGEFLKADMIGPVYKKSTYTVTKLLS
jgi:hypothetical protein